MENRAKRMDMMLTKLKARGFRLTPQRMAVLKILSISEGHPSVEKIYDRVRVDFPTTSLATIYKTVTLLKEIGEVLELEFSTDSNRYDGSRPYPHPHLICTKCREIVDPDVAALKGLEQEIMDKTGYRILNHRLDFYGVCPRCQEGD